MKNNSAIRQQVMSNGVSSIVMIHSLGLYIVSASPDIISLWIFRFNLIQTSPKDCYQFFLLFINFRKEIQQY